MKINNFIKQFLPERVDDVKITSINLDIDDLGIADILRNINRTYPIGSRNRNAIESGDLAVAVRCTSELLSPLTALVIIIANEEAEKINIISKNFIVAIINESNIKTDDDVKETLDIFTNYLIKEYSQDIPEFNSFYIKFIYDPYELEEGEDY